MLGICMLAIMKCQPMLEWPQNFNRDTEPALAHRWHAEGTCSSTGAEDMFMLLYLQNLRIHSQFVMSERCCLTSIPPLQGLGLRYA